MAQIKYAVYPGYVISRYDGDRHFIYAGKLMELYGVHPKNCIIMKDDRPRPHGIAKDLICLFPREDGHYHIPK